MTANKGFLLSAGFGTRFKPQSQFLPKPALPFLNIPQALFPASALKAAGVSDFFYNSHHLAPELDDALEPYLKRPSIFEHEILESAGGIANAKNFLDDQENFWVANGDSLVFLNDPDVMKEAYDFHLRENAIATLIGAKKPNKDLSGLECNRDKIFTGISRSEEALHFIGFYIFNKSIFQHLKKEKQHIFHDVLLKKDFQNKTVVFDAQSRISWYETGNEHDFLNATRIRLTDLTTKLQASSTYAALKQWQTEEEIEKDLSHFLECKVWGNEFKPRKLLNDFLCIGKNSTGDFDKLNNSILGSNLNFQSEKSFSEAVLIHPSQWA